MLLVTLTEKSCLIVIGDGFATAMSADLIALATSAEKVCSLSTRQTEKDVAAGPM